MTVQRFLTLVGLVLAITFQVNAQQKINRSEVPPMLRSKFIRIFPNNALHKGTIWEKQGANYTLSFDKKGQKNSVTLDPKGEIVQLRSHIYIDQLPNEVLCYLEDNYKLYFQDSALKTVDKKGTTTYELIIFRNKADKTTLLFDKMGNFLSVKKK